MTAVAGYSYQRFCQGIAERDGAACYVRELLIARRAAIVEAWGGGQGEQPDSVRDWIPRGLLKCDGPLDGHHWLGKSWIKREFPSGGFAMYEVGVGFERHGEDDWRWPLAVILSDHRNGSCICRRHHDLIERKLVVIRRNDLPAHVEDFAAELGDRAVARLDRDYGLRMTETAER